MDQYWDSLFVHLFYVIVNKDMMLRTHVEADLDLVRQRRRQAAKKSNIRENKRRIAHTYKPGDYVLILTDRMDPTLNLHQGPFKVTHYNKMNGTLQIRRKNYIEPINVRNVRPCFGHRSGGE